MTISRPSAHTRTRSRGWKVLVRRDPTLTRRGNLTSYLAETPPLAGDEDTDTPPPAAAAAASGPSKYVPPSMRNRGPGESMSRPGGSRDDLPTLRVTNISEDTQENDLRELFGAFGRVVRVYVGRDRDTGIGKGFAFVSFEDRAVAQRAMEKMHGRGYDSLILNVQWSRKYPPCDFLSCTDSQLCGQSLGSKSDSFHMPFCIVYKTTKLHRPHVSVL